MGNRGFETCFRKEVLGATSGLSWVEQGFNGSEEGVLDSFSRGCRMRCRFAFLPVFAIVLSGLFTISACTDRSDTSTVPAKTGVDNPVQLTVAADQPSAVISQGSAELEMRFDKIRKILYYDCGDFHVEYTEDGFREYTSRDRLDFTLQILSWPTRVETYVFNGRRLSILIQDEYPTQEQVDQFKAFYESNPEINSLEANADGEMMVRLLQAAQPQIMKIWQERDPEAYDEYLKTLQGDEAAMRPRIVEAVCAMAKACVAIKCWFGGLANSVCAACGGVTVACYIMEAFGW
jgi:hypothetical protein